MHKIIKAVSVGLTGFALSQALAGAALAAEPKAAAPQARPSITFGQRDAKLAPAGTYKLDSTHAAVLAKVSHVGYSYSIFRFDDVTGSLTWDPAKPEASKLSVTVDTASIKTNVPGFAEDLRSDKFLKSSAFPKATFTSTAFRPTDPAHGQVDGQLSLMGKTAPATFDVELVGAGPGFGAPRLGVEAKTRIKPTDFGLDPMFGEAIELVVDVEFSKAP